MVERLLTIKTDELNNIDDKDGRLSKNASFNTDDDDYTPPVDSQQPSETDSKGVNSGTGSARVDALKRSLLGVHSPSIDSINDADGLTPDALVSERAKKRKQRRATEQANNAESKVNMVKPRPWYTKIDLTKPIIYMAILFVIYLMWVKRDVWIPRLLTSNSRIRHIAEMNEEKTHERDHSPHTSSSSSDNNTTSSNSQQDASNNNDDKNNNNNNNNNSPNNDHPSTSNNDDNTSPTPTPTKQKLNIRIRRNKMSFSKERGGRKNRHIRNSKIDDDAEVEDDVVDDSDTRELDRDDVEIKDKEPIAPSHVHSSKKRHKSTVTREKNRKIPSTPKTSLISSPHNELFEQLQKLIRSRERHGDLLTALVKETGIKKAKLKQLIQQKDFQDTSLDVFISFLNSYDSTLLIVPK